MLSDSDLLSDPDESVITGGDLFGVDCAGEIITFFLVRSRIGEILFSSGVLTFSLRQNLVSE